MHGVDMNDPHIEKLYYRVIIPDHTDYDNAPPISGETDEFKCLLSMDQLVIEVKTHFSSEDMYAFTGFDSDCNQLISYEI
jgi:hypothetical protein